MTRKDFVLIAATLKAIAPRKPLYKVNADRPYDQWVLTVQSFARKLQDTNPQFDSVRFTTACGYTPDVR